MGTAPTSPDPAIRAIEPFLDALGRMGVLLDEAFCVLDASERFLELTGTPLGALRGRPVESLLGADLFGPQAAFRDAVSAGERKEGWRASLCDTRGRVRPVSVSAGRMTGTPARYILMLRVQDDEAHEIPMFEGMVGRSAAMQRIFRLIELLRDNDATVLVTGESGTGKELIARALHTRSHRAAGPFVAVNCGALPLNLLESELFGHVRGAFTGAVRDRPGRFELARSGTIFLDEVGDMPLPLQVKLLRVLQERTFERVGESRPRVADVRIVAATHVDLLQAVAEGRFRDDLYYRLRVVPIEVPPLRERKEDLELLVGHLLRRIGRRRGRALRLAPSTMRALLSHRWPGNVRELENVLEYATAVCEGQTVHLDDLPPEVRRPSRDRHGVAHPATHRSEAEREDGFLLDEEERIERERILLALRQTGWRRARAAERLGISRTTLWRKMKTYRLIP